MKIAIDTEKIVVLREAKRDSINADILLINEQRVLAGYEPIEGGDVLLVPANKIPLGEAVRADSNE